MGNLDEFIDDTKSASDVGQAVFMSRSLLSLLKSSKEPSLEAACQMAFDLFHVLFRYEFLVFGFRAKSNSIYGSIRAFVFGINRMETNYNFQNSQGQVLKYLKTF